MKYNKYNWNSHSIMGAPVGQLVPFFYAEVTPGDIWQGNINSIFRLAPLNKPLFMQMHVQDHLFYIPYRLLQDEFPEIWTGEDTSTAWPTITYNVANPIWAYYGVASNTSSTPEMNAFPVRAYNLVWNEHIRNPLEQSARSLDEVATLGRVHHRSNEYYGSIQTEIQQGTAVTLDSSGATIPVTEVREKMAEQRYRERRATYGEQYDDVLKTEFGVNVGDVRMQRPEHIGRGRAVMGISEVVATATSASQNTGEYVGHGITTMRTRLRRNKFKEPGCIIGVRYIRPRLQLNTSCPHMFLVQDREDLYQPNLTHDTVSAVSSAEVYFDSATYSNFGYHPRYEHLRKPHDTIMNLSDVQDMAAYVELASTPSVTYLHQVQAYNNMFQSAADVDLLGYSDIRFNKLSVVPKRRK